MAVEPAVPEVLARATAAAREEEPFASTPQGWVEISDSIMTRVRGLKRPGEPLRVWAPGSTDGSPDDRGSTTYLSSRIVVDELRRLLTRDDTHAPERIDLQVEGKRLLGVELALVASYGVPLRQLADQVRADVLDALHSLLGPDPALDASSVGVGFTDLVDGDPRTV
jgi:uncharacterized alkaline shock family protein YloU